MDTRFAELRADMERRLNTQTWTIVGTLVALGALLTATVLWGEQGRPSAFSTCGSSAVTGDCVSACALSGRVGLDPMSSRIDRASPALQSLFKGRRRARLVP